MGDFYTYVCHYSPLTERRKDLDVRFDNACIRNVRWITEWDREEIGEDMIENKFVEDTMKKTWYGDSNTRIRRLSLMSLTLKHVSAWRSVVESGLEWGLVLEDDVILCDDFVKKLNTHVRYVDKECPCWGLIFIGHGCGMNIKGNENMDDKIAVEKTKNNCGWKDFTRCTDSYVISREGAVRMIEYYDGIPEIRKRIIAPVDRWMNRVIEHMKIRVWWSVNTLVTQGSQNGTYRRTVGSGA